MGFFGFLLLGLIAGAIAKLILPGKQGGGWLMTTPATISVTRGGTNQVLGQLPYQCSYDKKAGKTTAQIQLPSQ